MLVLASMVSVDAELDLTGNDHLIDLCIRPTKLIRIWNKGEMARRLCWWLFSSHYSAPFIRAGARLTIGGVKVDAKVPKSIYRIDIRQLWAAGDSCVVVSEQVGSRYGTRWLDRWTRK